MLNHRARFVFSTQCKKKKLPPSCFSMIYTYVHITNNIRWHLHRGRKLFRCLGTFRYANLVLSHGLGPLLSSDNAQLSSQHARPHWEIPHVTHSTAQVRRHRTVGYIHTHTHTHTSTVCWQHGIATIIHSWFTANPTMRQLLLVTRATSANQQTSTANKKIKLQLQSIWLQTPVLLNWGD